MLLRPEKPLTPTIAEITFSESCVRVQFPEKRDDFNRLVKRLDYHWDWPYWERRIPSRAGTGADRAVELGHRLLLAGFCVEFQDEALAQRAANGEYEPEWTRWISRRISGKYVDWFVIEWARREDFYAEARRLRGSRYDPPGVVVPSTYYEEILDFAEAHDFRLSDGAQALAQEARTKFEQAVIVAPTPKARKPKAPKPEPAGIADELKDEPL